MVPEQENVYDEEGKPVYVQKVDADGNPMVDDKGEPVYETDEKGNKVTQKVTVKSTTKKAAPKKTAEKKTAAKKSAPKKAKEA